MLVSLLQTFQVFLHADVPLFGIEYKVLLEIDVRSILRDPKEIEERLGDGHLFGRLN